MSTEYGDLFLGMSNCCGAPVWNPSGDKEGLCKACGEWCEVEAEEEEEEEEEESEKKAKNIKNIILSFCDNTGNMVLPWAEAGYSCFIFDIQHPDGICESQIHKNITTVGGNILNYQHASQRHFNLKDVKISFAFPPCTDLAVSGARYFKSKGLTKLIEALQLVDACRRLCEETSAPWFLENPVSTISSYWRKPDYVFDPCNYGGYLPKDYIGNSMMPAQDAYAKKTCLWTGGGFIMPLRKDVQPEKACEQGSWLQKLGGKSAKTKSLRSATPMGFAKAVYEFNK